MAIVPSISFEHVAWQSFAFALGLRCGWWLFRGVQVAFQASIALFLSFKIDPRKNNDSDPHFPKAVSDMLELEAGTRSLKRLLSVYFCLENMKHLKTCEVWRCLTRSRSLPLSAKLESCRATAACTSIQHCHGSPDDTVFVLSWPIWLNNQLYQFTNLLRNHWPMIVITCVTHCSSLHLDQFRLFCCLWLCSSLLISAHLCSSLHTMSNCRGLSTLLHAIHGSTFVLARTPAKFLAKYS